MMMNKSDQKRVSSMTKFTQEQINDIIDLKRNDGRQIDIFELHGVLFLGNPEDGGWDLSKNYTKFSEHNIPISMDDFKNCETGDDIRDTFGVVLEEMIVDKLL